VEPNTTSKTAYAGYRVRLKHDGTWLDITGDDKTTKKCKKLPNEAHFRHKQKGWDRIYENNKLKINSHNGTDGAAKT